MHTHAHTHTHVPSDGACTQVNLWIRSPRGMPHALLFLRLIQQCLGALKNVDAFIAKDCRCSCIPHTLVCLLVGGRAVCKRRDQGCRCMRSIKQCMILTHLCIHVRIRVSGGAQGKPSRVVMCVVFGPQICLVPFFYVSTCVGRDQPSNDQGTKLSQAPTRINFPA